MICKIYVGRDWEMDVIRYESKLAELTDDNLPRGFWTSSEWSKIVMEVARVKKMLEVAKEELRKELVE